MNRLVHESSSKEKMRTETEVADSQNPVVPQIWRGVKSPRLYPKAYLLFALIKLGTKKCRNRWQLWRIQGSCKKHFLSPVKRHLYMMNMMTELTKGAVPPISIY